jgi:hypothetical protein
MTKFLKAANGEILVAGTDLKSGREAITQCETIKKETVQDKILKG